MSDMLSLPDVSLIRAYQESKEAYFVAIKRLAEAEKTAVFDGN